VAYESQQSEVRPLAQALPLNSVLQGDCLDVLPQLPAGCADLIYIDPPFGSGRVHESSRDALAGSRSFDDRFASTSGYIQWMRPRLAELQRLLADSGTLFYHCDWHSGHYVKLLLDEFFGEEAFLNEIIWRYGLGGSSRRYLPRKHDTIFWYAKNPAAPYVFNPPLVPAQSRRLAGRMKKMDDVWEIPALNNMAKERLGYPTQKPLELLSRIVEMASLPGQLVLDSFCGSGTTLEAAARAGRSFIGIDSSPEAIALARLRLGLPAT
jgi:site-specific DNA-methyltransferase (adenine-specific)